MGKKNREERIAARVQKQASAPKTQNQPIKKEPHRSDKKKIVDVDADITIKQQDEKIKIEDKPLATITENDNEKANDKEEVKSDKALQDAAQVRLRKHNRIIIRNLIVDINQKHLKKLLSPFGEVTEINIPMHPDKKISKGFAFVEFATKNQCHNAINKLNATSYKGRTIILDFSIAKRIYLQEKLTKEKQMEEEQKSNSDSEQEEEDEKKVEKEDPKEMQNQDDQDEQDDEDQEAKEEQAEKHQEDLSTMIFIRNIPTSIVDQDLFNHFRKYGKIKYARVVIDRDTNLSKGSGFVKFMDAATAKQLVDESRSYELFLSKVLHRFEPNPKINLEMDGKIIKIFDAMSRQNLETKVTKRNTDQDKSDNKKTIPMKKIRSVERLAECDKNDKRNIKLALEGIWRAEETMNKNDYAKFKAHEREKMQKLKNPNHFVSTTRIILKNMSKAIDQEQIRTLAIQYLKDKSLKPKELKSCKLMLDQNRDKSAGFAFLEFSKHQLSLGFINTLKQEPEKLSNFPYVCEFTIEDARKLLKKNKKGIAKPK